MSFRRCMLPFVVFAVSLPLVSEAGWPKIPKEERALESIPDHPNAPAVILLREGDVNTSADRKASYIEVYTRIKILTEEGVEYGTFAVESGRYNRSKGFEGRTHLPDGRVVNLSKDAKFVKKYSDYYNVSLVSCAMPEVVPGAIVEFRYRTHFDSHYRPQVWYFQAEIPTLLSRVTYHLPEMIKFYPIELNTLPWLKMENEVEKGVRGVVSTYSMKNVPPVPDEPYRFPYRDLAARVIVMPRVHISQLQNIPLLESWESLIDAVVGSGNHGYSAFRRNSGDAKRQARALTAGIHDSRAKAEAVYRWVRDEIDLDPFVGIIMRDKHTADRILSDRIGDHADLAVLLEIMLDAVGVDASVAWANPRNRGRVFPNVPNPRQFRSVLVVAEIDGERFFLDPSDSRCAFGGLPPALQGVPCLIVKSPEKYQWVDTPRHGADASTRVATVELAVGEDGSLAGVGSVELSGCHAWRRLQWRDSDDETKTAWKEWIEDGYSGFDVEIVEVNEDVEATTVDVRWTMNQREEEVLGDEVEVSSAGPLAVSTNPFTLEPNQRVTPVQLSFPNTNVYRLTLSWPDSWTVDAEPAVNNFENSAGRLSNSVTIDTEQHTATIDRTLVLAANEFVGAEAYASVRDLYRTAVANDTKSLVLAVE